MYKKYVKKRYSFRVEQASQVISKKFELDKNIKLVRGLLISSSDPFFLFYRGSQKIELNGEELFPEGWESRLLMSGISVPPNEKFADLGDEVLAGNGELKVVYKDDDNTNTQFQPYEVSIYLVCELA